MRVPLSFALQAAALLGAAGLCALISNGLARPERRLAWTTAPPPVAVVIPVPAPPQVQNEVPPALPAPRLGPTATPAAAPKATSRLIPPPPAPFPPRPGQPLREIGSAEADEAFKAGVPFLDARRSAEYELGRVKGAWSLPIWESTLEERLVEFEAQVNQPPEAALVLYCSGGTCEDSHLLASRLFKMGYRNLLIYTDGYPDWVAQARPIAQGKRP